MLNKAMLLLLHASSAVEANDLAIDPFAILGSEEADNASDIDGLTNAVQWRPGCGVLDFVRCDSIMNFEMFDFSLPHRPGRC